jgi:hypothetical protein
MGLSGASVTIIQLAERGDPAAFDLTEAGMTMDAAWHNWDVSAIVTDPDASWVLLRVLADDATPGTSLQFRKDGNANAIAAPGVVAQVNGIPIDQEKLVPCSTSQIIEYMASAAWDSIDIAVLGWIA